MLVERQWQDVPELFEAVVGALDVGVNVITEDGDSEVQVRAFDEVGPYGDRGQIILVMDGGRRFALKLWEVV
jgi:hypothetical protein